MRRAEVRSILDPWRRRGLLVAAGMAAILPPLVAASCGGDQGTSSSSSSAASATSSSGSSSSASGASSSSTSGSGGSGGAGSSSSASSGAGGAEIVKVQILAINDFHGNLEPPAGSGGKIKEPNPDPDAGPDAGPISVDTGGAAYLATHIATLRAQNPNTIVVSSGDLVGASPLASALFHDEPAIEVMNMIGLDYNGVGNHEFDKGLSELLRLQYGGCHPSGCVNGMPFSGAGFKYLAANVFVDKPANKTLFPAYLIRDIGGVKVAFIGMTLKDTPTIVTPTGVAGLTFDDEVATVNNLVPEVQKAGAAAIVVLLHQGGFPDATSFYDECKNVTGPITDIAAKMSPAVDVIASAHTHTAYNCMMSGKLVTSAASFGRLITDISLDIDKAAGKVVNKAAENVLVTRTVPPDMNVAKLVSDFVTLAAPLAKQQIGTITGDLKYVSAACNGLSTMGMVIADAQLAATQGAMFGDAVVALMNPGGVRADLIYAASAGEPVDGIVSYGEAFTVQPFGNSLVVMSLSGADIKAALEQQFATTPPRILQPSAGFTYSYDAGAPLGSKVDPMSIMVSIAGKSTWVDPAKTYRVTVNSFLATGGDGFVSFNNGTNRLGGAVDIDALADYFAVSSPVTPPAADRITVLNPPMPCP